jgi:hypothetical protein
MFGHGGAMPDFVTGGCKCGLVRYQGTRFNAAMFRCHCRDCQQLTGSGHAEMVPLAIDDFSIGDRCKIYEMPGGSGKPTFSGFCPNCGSQLTRNSSLMKDRIYVHAASLDDPGHYQPEKSIYAASAQIWDQCAIIESD